MGAGNANTEEVLERIPDLPKPLTQKQYRVIANQQSKSVCQITTRNRKATGFLCRIPNAINPVLITCNHVLNEDEIKPGEEIQIYFTDENGDKHSKTIKIDKTRTTYTIGKPDGEEIDTTIIELRPDEDKLNEQEFLEIDNELMSDNVKDKYKDESVYLIYYKVGKGVVTSFGIIKGIKENRKSYTLFHSCDTESGSSGGPIILYNHKVIGAHRGRLHEYKTATLLQYPIKEYLKKLKQKKLDNENKNVSNVDKEIDIRNLEKSDSYLKYKKELKFDENLPILPNYAEKFSVDNSKKDLGQKIQLKCNYIKEKSNQKTKNLKIIILNDKNIEKPRNYIKEHYRFKKYVNYKNLVDELVLSRKDIDNNKHKKLNHDLEKYNLYAEILNTANCDIFNKNEIDNIRNQLEKINRNIDSEINLFTDLCFNLIEEYLKFDLVKKLKFNQCKNCGTKCLYILFSKNQKNNVEKFKPTNDELKKGINIVKHILDQIVINNLHVNVTEETNLVTNVIYLNEEENKNEIELIEKSVSGNVLYIKNMSQLKFLLNEINQKNKENYKFLLILGGKLSDDLIEFLNKELNKIYKDIVDKTIIYCGNKQQYLNLKFIDSVIDNPKSLEEYIKNFKQNSKLYKTFSIINYESYTKTHNKIHKLIAKYYGKVEYNYKDAINLFKEFLFNEYKGDLRIKTDNEMSKKDALLLALEVFSTNEKEKIIKKYTEEINSYYQDFNYWLNSLDKTAINKIAYFVSSLMFALNNRNTGVKSKEILYRGINIDFSNIIKYYMNYIKDDNIICFASFTSTSLVEEIAKNFIDEDNFGVLFKINYNYQNSYQYLAINISNISTYDYENEHLFLPFTFYKMRNFDLNIENKLVNIELDCIFKKEILEENLNEKNNIIYNKKDNIMELDKKTIVEEKEFLIDNKEVQNNEISLKIKIEKNDVNKTIYFLDNTNSKYSENNEKIEHKHDNLLEINENNTALIIDKKKVPFKKSFIPKKCGIYSIKLIFNFKLSNCAYMFCQCNNICGIDFSKFNTEDVIDMKYMFYICSSLTSLNLSSFNTEKVTDMQWMFYNCSSLIKIDLSSFNTEKVTNMERMFYCCSSLTSLNLSSFNTQKVINMSFMFGVHPLSPFSERGCFSLTSLDLSSFNTKNVKDMEGMFWGCSNLKYLDLRSFNTQNVTNMKGMFSNCSALTSLNLSSFKLQKNVDTKMIFDGCERLSQAIINKFNRLKKKRCLKNL